MQIDHRLIAAGLMAVIFVSGGVAGGFVTRALVDDRPPEGMQLVGVRDGDRDRGRRGDRGAVRGGPPGDPRALMSSRAVEQLTRRLDLSSEQSDSVDAILERGRERASTVFAEVGPRLRTLLDSTNLELRAVLDSAQQEEFDQILQEDRDVLGRRFIPPDSSTSR